MQIRRSARWMAWGTGGTAAVLATVVGIGLLIPGCSVGYVTRQSFAHLTVLAAREEVEKAIADGHIPDEWISKIETLQDAKRFGAEELGLPTEELYETISLAKPGPTWIVTACPKDSLTPVTWWFPFVGRVAYKGFYNREHAEGQAERLGDVDVLMYPASAFSTLGWFRDPIRPSMLEGDDERIVNLVLHESSHSYLYWKGQTNFNESFASFVGDVGAILYLRDRLGEDCKPCSEAPIAKADAAQFSAFIEEVVAELTALYAEPISRDEKIRRREGVFEHARTMYRERTWAGDTYAWFPERRLDNAVILSYRRYDSGQEVFDELLERCGGDLVLAMSFVRDLDWPRLPKKTRRETGPMELLEQRLEEGTECAPADGSKDVSSPEGSESPAEAPPGPG